MATHSTVLAWRIPGTVEPGGLPSMGSHRVGHDWSDLAAAAVAAVTVSAFILFNLFSYDFRVRCERITSKYNIFWKCFNLKILLHMWQFVPYILRKPLYLWLISCVPLWNKCSPALWIELRTTLGVLEVTSIHYICTILLNYIEKTKQNIEVKANWDAHFLLKLTLLQKYY